MVKNGLISNQAIAEGLDPSGNVVNDLSDDNSNFEDDSTVSILCQDEFCGGGSWIERECEGFPK